MQGSAQYSRLKGVWQWLKPWTIFALLFVVLRYTGLMAGISYMANKALMGTGALDAEGEELKGAKDFDYAFSLRALDGTKVDIAQYKGKVIFLNLWATWCGPCRVEMPSIQNLYNKVGKDNVVFLMVSLDEADDLNRVKGYIESKEHTFPVYMPLGYLPDQLQVPSIPTTFVVSPEGKVVMKKSGTANYDTDEFLAFLENLAKGEKKGP